jgi:glycosyltransferase involved in cell wall biosynthesis
MRLALVTRRYPPLIGGAEKVLSYLAVALATEGADVAVVTSRVPGMDLPAWEDTPIAPSGPERHRDGAPPGRMALARLETSSVRFWGTWRYMRKLRRWFDENPVDLAYVSMLKHDAYVAVGAGMRLGFPVVLRPEGAGPTGDVAWQTWGNFGRRIGRRCRQATCFIAISQAIEDDLQAAWRRGPMRPSPRDERLHSSPREPRIVAIPNGVPVPAAPWQPRADWRAAPRAVFVGRLAAEKGLETLIDAWPLVRSVHANARLVLIGEGPERPALEVRVLHRGLSLGPGQAVELPGAVPDAIPTLRDADLFVLPSREEGMSIALLEAMALGIPSVASSISGNRCLISDFKHGRLAPPNDPEGLACVIREQWADFDRAVHMGCAARSRVEREFSIQGIARKHLELFQEIVRGWPSRASGRKDI